MPECQNCGEHVSERYCRVFTPNDHDEPRVCPQCPDRVRNPDGTVREARSHRRADRDDEPAQYDASRAATDGGQEVDR